MNSTLGSIIGGVALAMVVSCLQGCTWGFITGESGLEYSLRINPITETESTQAFDTRTIRLGRSKQSAKQQGDK